MTLSPEKQGNSFSWQDWVWPGGGKSETCYSFVTEGEIYL